MSGFPVFIEGELTRQIAIRGLSIEAFSKRAGVDEKTVSRAIHGQRLKPKSFGKIIVALGAIPILDGPVDLIERSA